MVSIRALRFVLEFVGEKHMRNWLTAHVRLGRLSWQGSEVFPPGEAAELNARLENLEDEVRVQREQQEKEKPPTVEKQTNEDGDEDGGDMDID